MIEIEEILKGSAIVVRETLLPVEGEDATFSAPTFAGGGPLYFPEFREAGGIKNAVLIDSVESQANRLEVIFKEKEYSNLVPQISLRVGNLSINLLDLGHRITDAMVRYSELEQLIWGPKGALKSMRNGDCSGIAKIAPTSFLFGFWDSRETGVKWPRLLRSEIWAYNVLQLGRKGTYAPAVFKEFKPEEEWKVYTELLDLKEMKELQEEMGEASFKELLSSVGLSSVPWPKQNVLQNVFRLIPNQGSIQRTACLHLVGLRSHVGVKKEGKLDETETFILQNYLLGLGLVVLTYPQNYDLRQGCLLRRKSMEQKLVFADGREEDFSLDHTKALDFARKATEEFKKTFEVDFGPREFEFKPSKERLQKEYTKYEEKKRKKGKGAKEEE